MYAGYMSSETIEFSGFRILLCLHSAPKKNEIFP